MLDISFEASQYVSSSITFFLIGSSHFLLRSSAPSHFFKKLKADILIQPYICGTQKIDGCFAEGETVTINVKGDMTVFFVGGNMIVKNIKFDFSDSHLTDQSDQNKCYATKKVCCSSSSILTISSDPLLNCKIDSSVSISAKDNKQKMFGLFTLFYDFDGGASVALPTLKIENVHIVNFYSIHDDSSSGLFPTSASILFLSYNNLPFNLVVSNMTLQNSYLRYGIFLRTNENSITHNMIFNTQAASKMDFNETLKIKSNVDIQKLNVIDFNVAKVAVSENEKPNLFSIDSSAGIYLFSKIYVNKAVINQGVFFLSGVSSSDIKVTLQHAFISSVTSYYLSQFITLASLIFTNNTFASNMPFNNGFIIKNIQNFLFDSSKVIGGKMPAGDFFQIETSLLSLNNSLFSDMYFGPDVLCYFIRTVTKIYVASDTQFKTSVADPNPFSPDQIIINNTIIKNCDFLLFVNEHSVLNLWILNSLLQNVNSTRSSVMISITCERAVIFNNITLDGVVNKAHFVALLAGRNFTFVNSKLINSK